MFKIALLTNGEIFGEEDLMKNRKRSYSIKCISPKGIVRIISKKNFIQRVCVDKTTQSLIEEMNEKKDKWFQVKIEETRKIFQTNKEILTQNMSKDFILNKFLKNHPKSKINEKYIQLENIDKMRTTKFFRFKRSLNSQSLEAERYLEEKAEFEKIKSDFEKKMCSNSSQKKM